MTAEQGPGGAPKVVGAQDARVLVDITEPEAAQSLLASLERHGQRRKVLVRLLAEVTPEKMRAKERAAEVAKIQAHYLAWVESQGVSVKSLGLGRSIQPTYSYTLYLELDARILQQLLDAASRKADVENPDVRLQVSFGLMPKLSQQASPLSASTYVDMEKVLEGLNANGAEANGSGQLIAILDGGVQTEFGPLVGRVHSAYAPSFGELPALGVLSALAEPNEEKCDLDCKETCHGTNVAWIAARCAPGAKILSVRIDDPATALSSTGTTFSAGNLLNALDALGWEWAELLEDDPEGLELAAVNVSLNWDVKDGNDIFDCACDQASCGGSSEAWATINSFREKVDRLWSQGVAVVVAAGNDDLPDNPDLAQPHSATFPGCVERVESVVASRPNKLIGSPIADCGGAFQIRLKPSNWSMLHDLAAPGAFIIADVPYKENHSPKPFNAGSGTSIAAPFVSGAIARLRSDGHAIEAVVKELVDNGCPIITYGDVALPQVNVEGALNSLRDPQPIAVGGEQNEEGGR